MKVLLDIYRNKKITIADLELKTKLSEMTVRKIVSGLQDRKIVTEKEIAMDFAVKVHRKFDRLIKASILFGSQAKNTALACLKFLKSQEERTNNWSHKNH